MNQFRDYKYEILLISCLTLLVHGWLFVIPMRYWDGWWILGFQAENAMHVVNKHLQESGHIFFAWIHRVLYLLPNPETGYRAIPLISIGGTGLFTFFISLQTGLLSRREALWLAALMIVFPGFLVTMDAAANVYLFCYFLFLGAVFFFNCAEMSTTRKNKLLFRALSLSLFFLSFFTNSLLVFYFGFLWLMFRNAWKQRTNLTFLQTVIRYINEKWLFIIWPFLFWEWKHIFLPLTALHENYYGLRFDMPMIAGQLETFFRSFVIENWRDLMPFSGILLGGALALTIAWKVRTHLYSPKFPPFDWYQFWELKKMALFLGVMGFILLMLGLVPYTLVGQGFGAYGFTTKNNLLIALPLGIMFLGFRRLFTIPTQTCFYWSWNVIATAFLILCAVQVTKSYLCVEALAAKNAALGWHEKKEFNRSNFSIAWIEDAWPVDRTDNSFPDVVWTFSMRQALPHGQVFVSTAPPVNRKYYSLSEINVLLEATNFGYAFHSVDRGGRQVKIHVSPGPGYRNAYWTGARYLWLTVRGKPMDEFFDNISSTTIANLSSDVTNPL